jgi:hypothetical protein
MFKRAQGRLLRPIAVVGSGVKSGGNWRQTVAFFFVEKIVINKPKNYFLRLDSVVVCFQEMKTDGAFNKK